MVLWAPGGRGDAALRGLGAGVSEEGPRGPGQACPQHLPLHALLLVTR